MSGSVQYDLLLKNGHTIDPLNHIDGKMDVAIAGGKIAAVAPDINPALAQKVVDVSGLYVTPGIIDIHVHVYHTREPEGLSVMADAHSFRSGVTTMVDTGTAGAKHFLHFKRTVIDRAKTRIFAYINIVDLGMQGPFEQDINTMDPELAASVVLAYPDICVGIKTAHYWTQLPFDDIHPPWAAVDGAIAAGNLCKKPVMVDFWPRPPERSYEELILHKMRPGDIHTHMYAQQFFILDDQGKPLPFVHEARARGIIFDVGHGAGSFWFRNAVPAMQNGFGPDSISTDLHTGNVHGVVVDMQTTMSKILNIGMPLSEVIMRSTVTPAQEIGHPELGHLSVGAEADVAVFKLLEGDFCFVDCGRAKMCGHQKLECQMTVRAGQIVYDPSGLSMPLWQEAPPEYWTIRR
ncbi:MAG TPA: amidohydrolase/deacetylase family metallohydrolase [Caldilineaceae bacterium]|nr:amidohydrolase/deacetylase family metallohydrolase [Caldilineaceae bacterium]